MTTPETPFENYGNNIWLPLIWRVDIDRNNQELIEELRIHAQRVCHGEIADAYIVQSFNTFTHGYVYYDDSQSESPILGFVIWEERHNKPLINGRFISFIHIHLICVQPNDKHICRRIMYDVEVDAFDRKINYISLYSLTNKVDLYKYFGYKVDVEDTLEMSKIIITPPPAPPKFPAQPHSNETIPNCDRRSPL